MQLKEYLKENPVNMIFEHPATLDMNEKQMIKVNSLMELKGLYSNLKGEQKKYTMNNPYNVQDYFSNYYPELKDKEYVACSYLDTKLQVIKTEFISEGTVNSGMLVPREVAKKALMYDSTAIMLAHNHPSGVSEPSLADIDTTNNIQNALATLNIKVLDHVVLGDNGNHTSLRQGGYIKESSATYQVNSEFFAKEAPSRERVKRLMQMER